MGEWLQLNDRKWEFRHNDMVLATIFHKPQPLFEDAPDNVNGKFSLWFKTPSIYAKPGVITHETHQFDSFEEACNAFKPLLEKNALDWCKCVVSLLRPGEDLEEKLKVAEREAEWFESTYRQLCDILPTELFRKGDVSGDETAVLEQLVREWRAKNEDRLAD